MTVKPRLESLLDNAAARWPQRVFVEFVGRRFGYAQMAAMANAVAAGLKSHGLRPGDRVALCMPNCPYFVAFFFGVLKAGGVVVTMNPLYTAAELHHLAADSGARLVAGVDVPMIADKLAQLKKLNPKLTVLACPLGDMMPWWKGLPYALWQSARLGGGFLSYADLLLNKGVLPQPPGKKANPRVALLQYTGGTTGTPKGAMLTHAGLLANTGQSIDRLGPDADEPVRILGVLPLFHVFALTSILLMGCRLGAALTLLPRFTVPSLLACIRASRPTLLPGVPALFDALANQPGATKGDFDGIKYGVSGGAPLPPQVKRRFEAVSGVTIREGYGLTEASPVVACTLADRQKEGSVGPLLKDTRAEIRDPKTGKKLKAGHKGEIWIKGPQVMLGYWNKPKETDGVLKKNWLRTGDVGHLDAEGWLFVTDRLKDIIIVNGYKVYPRMVEEVLLTHPAVAEVIVAGIAHPHKGEVPKAFIRLKPGATMNSEEMKAFVAARLNPIERPAEVEFRQVLPKSLIGKPLRKGL